MILSFLSKGIGSIGADTLLEKIRKTEGIEKAKNYNNASAVFKVNKPDSAILLARQALAIGHESHSDPIIAEALGNIADCYAHHLTFDSAVVYYLKAITVAEKTNNNKELASYYNGIGIVFYHLTDYDKAISYMKKAAEYKYKEGDMMYYITVNCNISSVLQRLGKFKEAISILLDSEKKLKQFNNPGILANLYNSLGGAYQQGENNQDSAEYYYSKNIALIPQPEYQPFRLAAFLNLGQLYLQKGQLDKAEFNLMKALDLSVSLARRDERIYIYENLSDLYETKQDYKNSLFYKKLQNELRDSIYSREKEDRIEALENKYQLEKRDSQINAQEVLIQKEKNKKITLLFILSFVAVGLSILLFYFWFRKRSRENLEKFKSTLFQNIAHEIRTPLTLINGPIHVLKRELQNEENKKQFESIEKNSEKLSALIDELLVTSKLQKEDYAISYSSGDIVLFTKNLIDNFLPETQRHQVTLHFNTNTQLLVASFPANAYEKIVNNLISNAIKYNKPQGLITVTLMLMNEQLCLSVSDTGQGMSKKDVENAFTRFYRSELQKNKSGFGVGLSVVKELVNLLKGTVDIESRLNQGTLVSVKFPLSELKTESIVPVNELPEEDFILIVEDDVGIHDFIRDILLKENIKTLRAGNGQEGFKLATELIPTIIITDVMMPVEDGLDMTKKLKAHELTKHIPVIMLSAKTSVQSRLQGMNSGADMYLGKPFNPEELVLLVKNTHQTILHNKEKYKVQPDELVKTFKERIAGNDDYLKKIVDAVEAHMDETDFSVNELADMMCISRSQLHRKITSLTDISTTNFIRAIRLEKAKDLLLSNSGNITEIAYSCGFNSLSYFSNSFAAYFGKSPSDFTK